MKGLLTVPSLMIGGVAVVAIGAIALMEQGNYEVCMYYKMTTMSTTKMRKRTTSDVSPGVRKRLSSRLTYLWSLP